MPAKLALIGLIPFAFLCYISIQLYIQQDYNLEIIEKYRVQVKQSTLVNKLIETLQKERRSSFIFSRGGISRSELQYQRSITDSVLNQIDLDEGEALKSFRSYTFLNGLDSMRNHIDTAAVVNSSLLMTYYSNAIYRMSTLITMPSEPASFLRQVYRDLDNLHLLSQQVTFMGFIRSNFFNVLYGDQDGPGTLYGLAGIYDILKSYEQEMKIKATPFVDSAYKRLKSEGVLGKTIQYIDTRFATYQFDTSLNAEQWWVMSGNAADELRSLQASLRNKLTEDIDRIYRHELRQRNATLIFLLVSGFIILAVLYYTVRSINSSLNRLKTKAVSLSQGFSDAPVTAETNDVIGVLADSINSIERNNRHLSQAADAIGRGDFNVEVTPRSPSDMLGNALVRMKENLLRFTEIMDDSRRESELLADQYQTVFFKSPIPIWIYDVETLKFLEVNDAVTKLYGFSRHEFQNMTIQDIRPRDERKKLSDHIKDGLMSNRKVWNHMRKTGEQIYVEITAHPIEFERRKARLVIANDITEKRKIEEALRQSEQTSRLIVSSSLDAIIFIDSEGVIFFWNRQAEKLFGWKQEEVENKPLSETIIPERYRVRHKEGMKRYMRTGEGPVLNRVIEISALNKNGDEFPVELAIVPIFQDGKIFFCGFIRDISERKKADEILLESERKYRLLFESNPLPMFMISPEDFSIVDVNEAAVNHYGYSKADFIQKNMVDLRPPEDRERFIKNAGQSFAAPTNAGMWTHIRKDGTTIKVEIFVQDLKMKDRNMRLVLVNDVSDKQRAEDKLRTSLDNIRQLTEHIQNVREEERIGIAREIHDELGQQLTVLKMDIAWLNKKLESADNKIKGRLKTILEMLDNTVKTVRKISSDLRPSMLDDLGLVAALEWHSQEFSRRTGIKIDFASDIGEKTINPKLATALYRIYQESLTNVARHAYATAVEASLKSDDNHLVLTIQDNGKGFALYGIENKKTLGILGMRERAKMLGGEYYISSIPGSGTSITVRLPENGTLEN